MFADATANPTPHGVAACESWPSQAAPVKRS
jgi:hypothetical protein